MKRTIPTFPQYTITKSGRIWKKQEVEIPFTHKDHNGLVHLAVRMDEQRQFVWKLLSQTWYDGAILLTRDGGFLNWNEDNVFRINEGWGGRTGHRFSLGEIQLIWWHYQHERIPCVSMSQETGLTGYSIEEYRRLIEEILISSVR